MNLCTVICSDNCLKIQIHAYVRPNAKFDGEKVHRTWPMNYTTERSLITWEKQVNHVEHCTWMEFFTHWATHNAQTYTQRTNGMIHIRQDNCASFMERRWYDTQCIVCVCMYVHVDNAINLQWIIAWTIYIHRWNSSSCSEFSQIAGMLLVACNWSKLALIWNWWTV